MADQGSSIPLMLQVLSLGSGVPPATLDACLREIAQNLSLLSVESLALAAHTAVTVASNNGGGAAATTATNNGDGTAASVANDPGSHASVGLLVEDVAAAVLSLLRDGREGGSPIRMRSQV